MVGGWVEATGAGGVGGGAGGAGGGGGAGVGGWWVEVLVVLVEVKPDVQLALSVMAAA